MSKNHCNAGEARDTNKDDINRFSTDLKPFLKLPDQRQCQNSRRLVRLGERINEVRDASWQEVKMMVDTED